MPEMNERMIRSNLTYLLIYLRVHTYDLSLVQTGVPR